MLRIVDLTFCLALTLDEISAMSGQASSDALPHATNPGGPECRQVEPYLQLLKDNETTTSSTDIYSGVSLKAAAGVAKEHLNFEENKAPTPTEELDYLAQMFNFTVQYTDFKKGSQNEFLSLVSLSTDPPLVCHGLGTPTDSSKEQAAATALKSLVDMGLDCVTNSTKSQKPLTPDVAINSADPKVTGSSLIRGTSNFPKND